MTKLKNLIPKKSLFTEESIISTIKNLRSGFKDVKQLQAEWQKKFQKLAQYQKDPKMLEQEVIKLLKDMIAGKKNATSSMEESFYDGMIGQMKVKLGIK